ncbi:hypothetical protein CMI37_35070 [Candidatus Pacearchaeota archaeon]|nr:hypothetical protein [Candidatus Pacearchaeota archaeon]|tara:strand:- start:73 stop:1104 length:1032 start_codon:yes stop_codon:yes gene_type:complete
MAPQFGTKITTQEEQEKLAMGTQKKLTEREKCEQGGGFWDVKTQTCIKMPKPAEPEPPKKSLKIFEPQVKKLSDEERKRAEKDRGVSIVTDRFGNEIIQTRQDIEAAEAGFGKGMQSAAEQLKQREIQLAEGQKLSGQIGQFQQTGLRQPGVIGEFDYGEAAIAGLRKAIPSAVGAATTVFGAGILGAKIAGTAGTVAAPGVGTAIGAALGFVGGITAGILSNMASQRRDTTTAQQRVLDEGKQNLQDWITLARTDSSRKLEALRGFNAQLTLIDGAYRQMKLDTQKDLLKFETALPNLAEFETFYSAQGERDFLSAEMALTLQAPSDPTWAMLEMAQRRVDK